LGELAIQYYAITDTTCSGSYNSSLTVLVTKTGCSPYLLTAGGQTYAVNTQCYSNDADALFNTTTTTTTTTTSEPSYAIRLINKSNVVFMIMVILVALNI